MKETTRKAHFDESKPFKMEYCTMDHIHLQHHYWACGYSVNDYHKKIGIKKSNRYSLARVRLLF